MSETIETKVTVIVLSYNAESFVSKCLLSVRNQIINSKLEVLVCDDASQDGSQKAIKRIISEEWPVDIQVRTFFHKKNLGAWNNLMFGIEQASGQYIAYIEADDYWTANDKTERQVQILDSNSSLSGVADGCQFVAKDGDEIDNLYFNWSSPKTLALQDCWYYPGFQSSGLMFVKSRLNIPKVPNSNILNDKRLISLLLQQGNIQYTAEKTVAYRYHENNLSSQTSKRAIFWAHLKWNFTFLRLTQFSQIWHFTKQCTRMVLHYVTERISK